MRTQVRTTDVARVTLMLPGQLWEDVKRLAPSGRRSQLVAEALAAEVNRRQRQVHLDDISQFQDYLRRKYGEMASCVDDIVRMREERDAELAISAGWATISPTDGRTDRMNARAPQA